MKCGQLIEYKMTKIFIEKPYTRYAGETIRRPFVKKSKLSITLHFASYKSFLKNKKMSRTNLPASFPYFISLPFFFYINIYTLSEKIYNDQKI